MEKEKICQRLTNEMNDQVEKIKAGVRGYNPTYYSNMIETKGGYITSLNLLSSKTPSDGFVTLLTKDRIDLTLEYLVFNDKEFRLLFDEQIIDNIRKRLGVPV